jgi:hypothetical protein
MLWKKILLFSILFFILGVVSTLYYLVLNVPLPLRKDPVPAGAYVVPWMSPNPSIEELNTNPQQRSGPPPFDIDAVMAGALKLNMTFNITVPGGARIIPSTVYLGHDSDYLYVGGKFAGMYTNPASTPNDTLPNRFSIFFDVTNERVLKQPESGSGLSAYMMPDGPEAWFYHDMMWAYSAQDNRLLWITADNYYSIYLNRGQPVMALHDAITEYDNSTGTVTMLLSRFLRQPESSELNALQIRPGERWVMGFVIELGYITNGGHWSDYMDDWPRRIYPYLLNDSSWWPKMVIDLTNPQPNFATMQDSTHA